MALVPIPYADARPVIEECYGLALARIDQILNDRSGRLTTGQILEIVQALDIITGRRQT